MIDKSMIPLATAPKAASVAAAGTLISGWCDAGAYSAIHAVVGKDAGAGTPALTFEQATTAAGAGAKALAWSGGTLATDRIEVTNDPAKLDVAGGFRFVRATVTVTGGAGTLCSLSLLGLEPRFA
ncbi:MAG: hypothetical protein L0Y66_11380 [Myxococcaceae bacterium]|nr:hypothetical protein [Myxococcaceae bacterium]